MSISVVCASGKTVKFLLLVDQLSMDQHPHRHLSIKDIGIILDRLSSKIVDVERLEREIERPTTGKKPCPFLGASFSGSLNQDT